jgi:hypothetical protein
MNCRTQPPVNHSLLIRSDEQLTQTRTEIEVSLDMSDGAAESDKLKGTHPVITPVSGYKRFRLETALL